MSLRSLKDRWATLDAAKREEIQRRTATRGMPDAPVEEAAGRVQGMALLVGVESDPFDGIVIVDPHDSNPNVRGPCCRRAKALDNLLDLTPIPVEIREPMLAQAGFPLLDAICGTCIGRFMRAGGKRSDLYEALGAPPELVAKFRSVE